MGDNHPNPVTRVMTHSTPITTALAIAIAALCFWIGQESATLKAGVSQNSVSIESETRESREWRKEVQLIISKLTSLSEDNKRRLDLLEE